MPRRQMSAALLGEKSDPQETRAVHPGGNLSLSGYLQPAHRASGSACRFRRQAAGVVRTESQCMIAQPGSPSRSGARTAVPVGQREYSVRGGKPGAQRPGRADGRGIREAASRARDFGAMSPMMRCPIT